MQGCGLHCWVVDLCHRVPTRLAAGSESVTRYYRMLLPYCSRAVTRWCDPLFVFSHVHRGSRNIPNVLRHITPLFVRSHAVMPPAPPPPQLFVRSHVITAGAVAWLLYSLLIIENYLNKTIKIVSAKK